MGARGTKTKSASSLAKADPTPKTRTGRPPSAARRPFSLAPTVTLPAVLDEPEGEDRRFRQLLYDISSAATYLESARSYLAGKIGLTAPQYNMLMVVAQYEETRGLSISDVAAHLHVSGTFVTAEVNKLLHMGLIEKLANPDDARSVLLRLTLQGEQSVNALQPELHFVNDRLFANLGATDFRHLCRVIAILIPDFERTIAILDALAEIGARGDTPRAKIGKGAAPGRGGRS